MHLSHSISTCALCKITVLKKVSLIAHRENSGAAGYRSPYLSHAKRALYHLSYSPDVEQECCSSFNAEFRRVSSRKIIEKLPPVRWGKSFFNIRV